MTNAFKARLIIGIVSILLVVAGVLVMVIPGRAKKYDAQIVEITRTYKTKNRGVGSSRHRYRYTYHEKVTVTWTDAQGAAQTTEGVKVSRENEDRLPKVGETIQLYKSMFGIKEYYKISNIGTALGLIIAGIIVFIVDITSGRRKRRRA